MTYDCDCMAALYMSRYLHVSAGEGRPRDEQSSVEPQSFVDDLPHH